MRCRNCYLENGLLIRGLCVTCAPERHAKHAAQMKVVGDMDAAYKAATGKSSLEDWQAYEQWLESPALDVSLQRAYIEAFSE